LWGQTLKHVGCDEAEDKELERRHLPTCTQVAGEHIEAGFEHREQAGYALSGLDVQDVAEAEGLLVADSEVRTKDTVKARAGERGSIGVGVLAGHVI
jgi:hypothetical protein